MMEVFDTVDIHMEQVIGSVCVFVFVSGRSVHEWNPPFSEVNAVHKISTSTMKHRGFFHPGSDGQTDRGMFLSQFLALILILYIFFIFLFLAPWKPTACC